MAGRQPVIHAGLRFTTKPAYWLRRVSHFPFFFESHNPSFKVKVHRIALAPDGETWPNGRIPIQVVFADTSHVEQGSEVPDLKIGEYTEFELRHIFTAYPGQTIIRIPVREGEWKTLYAYNVRREEAMWSAAWGGILAVAGIVIGIVIGRG
jgi:hypothetical protein